MLHEKKRLDPRLAWHLSSCDGSLFILHHELRCGSNAGYKRPDVADYISRKPEFVLYGFFSAFMPIVYRIVGSLMEYPCYPSLQYWGESIRVFYHKEREYYDTKTSIDFTAKALAAALSYLAIYNHGCWFRITRYQNRIQAGKRPCKPLWADAYSVAVGKKGKYVDFLPYCKEAIQFERTPNPKTATIHIGKIVSKYKQLTGVDLTEYHFKDIVIPL